MSPSTNIPNIQPPQSIQLNPLAPPPQQLMQDNQLYNAGLRSSPPPRPAVSNCCNERTQMGCLVGVSFVCFGAGVGSVGTAIGLSACGTVSKAGFCGLIGGGISGMFSGASCLTYAWGCRY